MTKDNAAQRLHNQTVLSGYRDSGAKCKVRLRQQTLMMDTEMISGSFNSSSDGWSPENTSPLSTVVKLSNQTWKKLILVINQIYAQNFCFTISLFHASTCFEHHVLNIRRSKLYYTASDIITPIDDRPVHRLRVLSQPVHRTATYRV